MSQYRTPLDTYDMKPEGMTNYLRHNGWHVSKKLAEWAARHMRRINPATGKPEKLEPWGNEQVEELLTKAGVQVEHAELHDLAQIANVARARFYKSSIKTEADLAQYIKDIADAPDAPEGHVFNDLYADCVRSGVPIPWDDVL